MTLTQENIGRESAPEPIDIDELRSAVRGPVFGAGDDGYEEAARIWNGAHDGRLPALVVRCSGPADVISALGFARTHDLEIAVRGGGHSIAGFSTGDGVAMIDLSALKRFTSTRRLAARGWAAAPCGPTATTRPRRTDWPRRAA